jgi:hypothetical protein
MRKQKQEKHRRAAWDEKCKLRFRPKVHSPAVAANAASSAVAPFAAATATIGAAAPAT